MVLHFTFSGFLSGAEHGNPYAAACFLVMRGSALPQFSSAARIMSTGSVEAACEQPGKGK
jgi:hypothetical protein